MFDIGWGELVVIGIVALIVIGPKELPTVLRTMGQWMTKIRRMASEFQGQFQEAMREAELADLKKQIDTLQDTTNNISSLHPVNIARDHIESAFEGKPKTAEPAPTPTSEPAPTPTSETTPAVPVEGSEPPAASPTAAAAEIPNLPPIDLPVPEIPEPVTEKNFAADAPSPPADKPKGNGA